MIKKINVFEEEGFFHKAVVEYADGHKENISGFSNIVEAITKFSMQEYKLVDELIAEGKVNALGGRISVNNVNFDLIKYMLTSHKLNFGDERKVVLIADMHGYHNQRKKADALAEAIKQANPHHIVIAGDHMNAATGRWTNPEVLGNFQRFVSNVSEGAPVVLSQGNHDINAGGEKQKEINKSFLDLEKLRPGSIFPLINDRVTIDGFEIIGYTPDHDVISDTYSQLNGVPRDKFVEEYNKNGVGPENPEKNIIEFAGHSPYLIAHSASGVELGKLVPVDVFLTGHLHNGYRLSHRVRRNPEKYMDRGYVERVFQKDVNGNIDKSTFSFVFGDTDLCRGVVYVDNSSQQKIMQLRNGEFYLNVSDEKNKEKWIVISSELARKQIIDEKLHALVITGGVKKFSPLPRPTDEPEITEIIYRGVKK